jgi:hypothetical protein
MKTFQIVTLFAFVASAAAFVPASPQGKIPPGFSENESFRTAACGPSKARKHELRIFKYPGTPAYCRFNTVLVFLMDVQCLVLAYFHVWVSDNKSLMMGSGKVARFVMTRMIHSHLCCSMFSFSRKCLEGWCRRPSGRCYLSTCVRNGLDC